MDSEAFTWINGAYMTERYKQFEDLVYEWNVRDEDVWICTFPKSGTTWTQEMVWLIMNNLDYEKAKVDLDIRMPYLELTAMYELKWCQTSEKQIPLYDDSFEYTKKMSKSGPICIKTHLPWTLLPKEIQENVKNPKIVYVCRNPKDVAVSFYHHAIYFHNYNRSLDDFCKLFLKGEVAWGPYWKHVLPFWQRRNHPNILFLSYEDMSKDLPSAIRKVTNFLGKSLTDDEITILSNHLSFSKMKTNKAVNKELMLKYFNPIENAKGAFIRSGKVNGYKEEMSSEIITMFNQWIKENSDGTGYEI